jgi:NAD(P)H-dependent flavin oxidoreductase YrpB (nitropropane dioxygenase family)
LLDGDEGGHMQRALKAFPDQAVVERILRRYNPEAPRKEGEAYKSVPMPDARGHRMSVELTMVGAFAEVWLAKELASQGSNRPGPVLMNLLTELRILTLPALYGAMLAGVDYIVMGAGVPRSIPGVIRNLANGNRATISLDAARQEGSRNSYELGFDPAGYPKIEKIKNTPVFLAIVASNILATVLERIEQPELPPNGFIIEGPTAGGHNAPPRNKRVYNDRGEPVYGDRDVVDLAKIAELGLPFWLAGGYGSPERLREAKDDGANGIQAGSIFALCRDSGMAPHLRDELIGKALQEGVDVYTDRRASPTGYPFKVAAVESTTSNPAVYEQRERVCDIGHLRTPYERTTPDGNVEIGYRCPSEPVKDYVEKGGKKEDTEGRKCLCNGLLGTIGFGQIHNGVQEPAIVTIGDDKEGVIKRIATKYGPDWSATDGVEFLRG